MLFFTAAADYTRKFIYFFFVDKCDDVTEFHDFWDFFLSGSLFIFVPNRSIKKWLQDDDVRTGKNGRWHGTSVIHLLRNSNSEFQQPTPTLSQWWLVWWPGAISISGHELTYIAFNQIAKLISWLYRARSQTHYNPRDRQITPKNVIQIVQGSFILRACSWW